MGASARCGRRRPAGNLGERDCGCRSHRGDLIFDAAWAALPLWARVVGWTVGPALAFVGSALASRASAEIAAWPLRSLPEGTHWSEHARLAWPVRTTSAFMVAIGMVVMPVVLVLNTGPVLPTPANGPALLAVVASWFGTAVGVGPVVNRVHGRYESLVSRMREAAVRLLAFYPHLLLLLGVSVAADGEWNRRTFAALAFGAIGLWGCLRGDVLDGMRILGLSRPPPPDLAARVQARAQAEGLADVRVDIVPVWLANAAAYPPGRRLFLTQGLLTTATEAQIDAIVAHEVAHLAEPRAVSMRRVAAAYAFFLPLSCAHPLLGQGHLVLFYALALGGLVVAARLGRVARDMEERADAHAAGEDGVYASALEAIYRANLLPAVMRANRAAHPHLYDRLASAGARPAWPRPLPPSRFRGLGAVLAGTGVHLGLLIFCLAGTTSLLWVGGLQGTAVALPALRLRPIHLIVFGDDAFHTGDSSRAIALYAAADALSEQNWDPAVRLAHLHARAGDCDAAARAARRAHLIEAETGDDDGSLVQMDADVAACFRSSPAPGG